MQPHTPFVQSEIPQSPNKFDSEDEEMPELEKAGKGLVSREKVLKDYKDNLRLVWDTVDDLAQNLDGKTVVTADHGELLGEWGRYGHYSGSKAEGLRKVPWYVISKD